MNDRSDRYPVVDIRDRPGVRDGLATCGASVSLHPGFERPTLQLHAPDIVLMTVVVAGTTRHVAEGVEHVDEPGTLSITHYGQVHSLLTYPGQPVDIINVYLDPLYHPLPPLPPDLAGVLPEIVPLHACLGNALNRVVRLRFAEPAPVRTRLEAIERELRLRPPGHADAARMLVRLFLIDCCRAALASGIAPTAPARQDGNRLDAVRQLLDTDYAAEHRLEDLAALAGMSPSYLCRSFKAYTGSTVVGYLLRRRLQQAMLRLRDSDDKILAIALECGFRDLSYFNRQFKSLVGMTPSHYRRPTD